MRSFLVLLFVIFFVPARPAQALVDMNSGSYSNVFIDIRVSSIGFEFELLRAYKSRTLYTGLFGFGWCSTLETRLIPVSNNEIVMLACGDGMTTRFVREGSAKDVELGYRTRKDRLSAAMVRLGLDETERTFMLSTIAAGPELTDFEKNELGAGARKLPIGSFVSSTGDRLDSTLSGVSSSIIDESGQNPGFDTWGRLKTYFTPGGELVQIEHIGLKSLRIRVRHNVIDLLLEPEGRQVREIRVNGETRATYEYTEVFSDGSRLLLGNTNQWGGKYSYQYTEHRNLTRIEWPDASSVIVEYDDEKDWAMAFTDRDACREDYTYSFGASPPEGFTEEGAAITEAVAPFKSSGAQWPDDPEHVYWAGVIKKCDGEITARDAYYFVHSTIGETAGAPVQLSLAAIHTGGRARALAYSEPEGEVTVSTYPLRSISKIKVSNISSVTQTHIGSFGSFKATRAPNGEFSSCAPTPSVAGRFTLTGRTIEVKVLPEFNDPGSGGCTPDRLVVALGSEQMTLERSGSKVYASGDFESSINVASEEFAASCHKARNLSLTEGIQQAIAGKLPCSAEERAILVLAVFETFNIY